MKCFLCHDQADREVFTPMGRIYPLCGKCHKVVGRWEVLRWIGEIPS